jgi:hypothetical protein
MKLVYNGQIQTQSASSNLLLAILPTSLAIELEHVIMELK